MKKTRTELIRKFSDHLLSERHLSESTASCYANDIGQFIEFIEKRFKTSDETETFANLTASNINLAFVDSKMIRDFMDSLTGRYSEASRTHKLSAIRTLYRFLIGKGLAECNPAADVEMPKLEIKPLRVLLQVEIYSLLNAPKGGKWIDARDRAILETLYSTGMKVGELVKLNLGDIDWLAEIMHIRKKGRRDRVVPMSSSFMQAIEEYLNLRKKVFSGDECKALFLNRFGLRLCTKSVQRMINKYLRMTGLDMSINCNNLRHTSAVHMLMKGADLQSVHELLGNRRLGETRKYETLVAGTGG